MVQFWSPLRELTPALRPGLWLMADKGRRIGFIRRETQTRFVCETPESAQASRVVLGSATTLPEAAKRLWEWGRETRPGWCPAHTLVELEPGIWAMPPRPGHEYAQGFIERETREGDVRFVASTWGTAARPTAHIGTFPALEAAAVAVWEYPLKV